MCGGTDTGGSTCHTICGVQYETCQSTQQGFGVVWRCMELSVWGHTLTPRWGSAMAKTIPKPDGS